MINGCSVDTLITRVVLVTPALTVFKPTVKCSNLSNLQRGPIEVCELSAENRPSANHVVSNRSCSQRCAVFAFQGAAVHPLLNPLAVNDLERCDWLRVDFRRLNLFSQDLLPVANWMKIDYSFTRQSEI
jgi:hypothetical protein